MSLETLVEISNKYGSSEAFVLAGGGNTSYKTEDTIWVKGSGSSLATITENGFVKMNRASLRSILTKEYPENTADREAAVLADMMAAKMPGEEGKRPSVEALLHELFPQKYVLHVHPCSVNALTCSLGGEKTALEMFPDCVWVDECEPGYILAAKCYNGMSRYTCERGVAPSLLFLQNHGVFFAADDEKALDALVSAVMDKIAAKIEKYPDFTPTEDAAVSISAASAAPRIRMAYSDEGIAFVRFSSNKTVLAFAESDEAFDVLRQPLSPDHIVYCKAEPLFLEKTDSESVKSAFEEFVSRRGFKPKIVFVKNLGMFAVGSTYKEAATAEAVWRDAMTVTTLASNFGGVRHMAPRLADFIINWEVESYRAKVSLSAAGSVKRLENKIAVVTGSAQGFGAGIADYLASEGAAVVIADMNIEGAEKTAALLHEKYSVPAIAVSANVSDEHSVRVMIEKTVLAFGGLDVFVNNAGIVRAGSLEEMTKQNFELVTSVNYTAYFLCAKYASAVMKAEREMSPTYMTDIIEINSKSGLKGSNKNFAYAGSKFGGIGLTQSFALELAPYGIKVNAVCPGNFLDGPLWSDPDRGLFVQYLRAGKVPGAKTVDDVRAFYEAKVPLGRGCRTEDVSRAVLYIIEQKYETGQAIPVTGGQEMLS